MQSTHTHKHTHADYKKLSVFKARYPKVPLVALTATATARVQHDVRQQLCIPRCVVFKSSFNRPNLRCAVCGCVLDVSVAVCIVRQQRCIPRCVLLKAPSTAPT